MRQIESQVSTLTEQSGPVRVLGEHLVDDQLGPAALDGVGVDKPGMDDQSFPQRPAAPAGPGRIVERKTGRALRGSGSITPATRVGARAQGPFPAVDTRSTTEKGRARERRCV